MRLNKRARLAKLQPEYLHWLRERAAATPVDAFTFLYLNMLEELRREYGACLLNRLSYLHHHMILLRDARHAYRHLRRLP